MKKLLAILLMLGLLATLTACGEDAAPAPAPEASGETAASAEAAPVQQETPAETQPAVEQTPVVVEQPEETPAVDEQPAEDPAEPEVSLLDTALGFVDQDVSLLVEAIGEPLEKRYEESCSGPGDDGIWTYDGLTVFTYTENGVEVVVDAE